MVVFLNNQLLSVDAFNSLSVAFQMPDRFLWTPCSFVILDNPCLLTLFTGGANECGQLTLTGRHTGKHTRQVTLAPVGACHRVACAAWTPFWVTMKHRGNVKTRQSFSPIFSPNTQLYTFPHYQKGIQYT